MKRVLLTGASGFVGRHAIAPLLACGYEVHAISSEQAKEDMSGVIWHRVDLFDGAALARLMAELVPSHLLHFAWYAEPGKFWRANENYRWVQASLDLFQAFIRNGGQRVVTAGTCAEYDWDFGFCSEDVTPCRPATPYGICKNALQDMQRTLCADAGVSSSWGRIFFMYGPGEHTSRLVASIINSLLRNEDALLTHGRQIRDFLHVEDVASAFVALLDSPVEGAVNISSGCPLTLRDVAYVVADCFHSRERLIFGELPTSKDEPPLLIGDCRKLSNQVKWSPRYDIHSGIEQTVSWWKSQHKETGIHETVN